jgi:hypothetical protein
VKQHDVTTLAEQVAEHLDGEWEVAPFPDDWGRKGAWLRELGTGAILSLGESQEYTDRFKDKLSVGTDYPKEHSERGFSTKRPKISVSASKTGVQIASDISRRLPPEYLPLLAKVMSDLAARQDYEATTSSIAGQIAGLVKVQHSPKSTTVSFYHSPYEIFRETMSEAKVMDKNEVELSLRLSPRDALRLLNMLIIGRFEDPDLDRLKPVEDLSP